MKTIGYSALALALLSCGAASGSTISIQASSPSVGVGQAFAVNVAVANIKDLFGYQFDVGFDPTLISAVAVNEGSFLALGGTTTFLPGVIDNLGGSITFNADILGGVLSGVDGSGTLMSFNFVALSKTGSSALQLFNVSALNSFGEGIPVTTTAGSVTVTGSAVTPEPGTGSMLGLTSMLCLLALLTTRRYRSRS